MDLTDFLLSNIISADPETPLKKIHAIMKDKGIRHLPITNNNMPIGIISDRDILKNSSVDANGELVIPDKVASEIMTRDPVSCPPSTPLRDVVATMVICKIDSFLIVDKGLLIGLVTTSDFLKNYLKDQEAHGKKPVPLRTKIKKKA